MDEQELFELVRDNYAKANKEYIEQQLEIALEYGKNHRESNQNELI